MADPVQDEARRALSELIDELVDASECAATSFLMGARSDEDAANERQMSARAAVLAALRDLGAARAAEEMKERCFRAVRSSLVEAPFDMEDQLCDKIEAAIRALPLVPASGEGGGR